MKSSILYQMGKLEESEKLTQRCLYEENAMQVCLWSVWRKLPEKKCCGQAFL